MSSFHNHRIQQSLRFEDYSTIFNGNVKSLSKAVVVPLDAEDVSK